MKKTQLTRPPDDVIQAFFPKGSAPTVAVEKFERQVAFILSALGEFNENYKYAYVTDLCTFKSFAINKKQLKHISRELGVNITNSCKLADVAKKMFKKEIIHSSRG
jgi:hypothetical protein